MAFDLHPECRETAKEMLSGLMESLEVFVGGDEPNDVLAHRYGVGFGVIKLAREELTKAREATWNS